MLEGLRYENCSFIKSFHLVDHSDLQNHQCCCNETSTQLAISVYEVQRLGHSSWGKLLSLSSELPFQVFSCLTWALGAGRYDEPIHTP